MGFYQPAQLVQDARRHGVCVLPADVRYSCWDCTLDPGRSAPALRLGLRMVKGMRQDVSHRLVQARLESPFLDLQDFINRANVSRRDLAILAEAAALRGLAGHRHRARWEIAASEKPVDGLALSTNHHTETVSIRPPSEADDTRADYASTGLTLGRHPIALLRPMLRHRRARTASELHSMAHGSRVRACGLVTMRQRPMTASGTIFLTLEDETGYVNAVIWPRVWERQRAEILGATVLAVDGVIEKSGETGNEVHHLIADRVHDFSSLAQGLQNKSRDFH
jgi:error-prone DNA polymerase